MPQNASELEKVKTESFERIVYNSEEQEFFKFLSTRANDAKTSRDKSHPEFDSMSYLQYLESNERGWNAVIEPKTDPRDWRSRARKRTIFSRGNAILGRLMEENFTSEFFAIDEDELTDKDLSRGVTDAVEASKYIEKSPYTEYAMGMELLKHGNVFVREFFDTSNRTRKELLNPETLDPFKQRWHTLYDQPHRRHAIKQIIRNDSVFLGDLSKLHIDDQPFIFVRTKQNFEAAKAVLEHLTRFKYVRPGYAGLGKRLATEDITHYDTWRMAAVDKNEVEIVEYIDPWNNEYQVVVQGIMMYPVGYPIPWGHSGYNVRMRGLYLINPHFAYCHGLAHIMRSDSEVRDFLMRYAVDRSLQDLLQPMLSAAKKTLTSRIFIPGNITHGTKPEDVAPLLQGQLPQSAITMIEMFEKNLDEDAISKILVGEAPSGDPTAFQISVQQKMATRALGPIVLNFVWLLQDLDFLRAQTILDHMTSVKTNIDPLTKEVTKIFQSLTLKDADFGDGRIGTHLIRFAPKADHPTSEEIEKLELEGSEDKPLRISYIDGDLIRNLHYKLYNEVKSSPRKNSDTNKILFADFLNNVRAHFPMTSNMDYLQNEFAKVWEKDPDKLFTSTAQGANPNVAVGQAPATQTGSQIKNAVTAGSFIQP